MRIDNLDLDKVLGGLKDFQRRTVDYVFQRLYLDPDPAHRFLVADEVGLGKTMVARGLIARTLEHLRDKVDRIDVVYVCSNAAIAQQNINRLNVLGERHFAMASRLTLLPEKLSSLSSNRVNFVSFTPGTTFDLGRRGGMWSERVLLHRMLCPLLPDDERGLLNLLQGTMGTDRWRNEVRQSTASLDTTLEERFRARAETDHELLERVREACGIFHRHRQKWPTEINRSRMALIGELRQLLAHVCVDALEPDLVILDEFQRFKDLLHGESEAAELAGSLMRYRDPAGNPVRVVLLSATPYRPLTTDDDADDNHYRDFIQTLRFLFNAPEDVELLEERLRAYRRCLFGSDGVGEDAGEVRDALEAQLRSVMVRTERVGSTVQMDAMVATPAALAPVAPQDLRQARVIGRIAQSVGAGDQTEYWKSAPYVVNFMKDYELKRRLDEASVAPSSQLIEAAADVEDVLLKRRRIRSHEKLDTCNGRLRALIGDTLDRGMGSMLWLPPSLPYVAQNGARPPDLTKALVFSSWNVVPDTIAAMLSYEAERRLVADDTDRPSYHSFTRKYRPLLRFAVTAGRETGMGALALMYPCVRLAESVDPLSITAAHGGPLPIETLKEEVAGVVRGLLEETGVWPGSGTVDPQWYWAALPLLDQRRHPVTDGWMRGQTEWQVAIADEEAGQALVRHVNRFADAGAGGLGRAPDDLVDVLTDIALGSPAVVGLRALGRLVSDTRLGASANLQAAAVIAGGFRTLYNLSESILLLRGDDEDAYWKRVASYGAGHDLQSVMDEYVHILRESLGLVSGPSAEVVGKIAAEVAAAVSIRTSRIDADEIQARAGGRRVRTRRFGFRCRFALRFSELKDDDGATLARTGSVQRAFNSPFRPFVLASTSIGQEGLDFHQYCHAVYHWNLPSNPVDMEQREGRVHRYKGHAVRKNIARSFGLSNVARDEAGDQPPMLRNDPWQDLFDRARAAREPHESDLIPFWIFPVEGGSSIERRVPILPFSKEEQRFKQLQRRLAVYRLVFGQPRQEDLMAYLEAHDLPGGGDPRQWRISLEPPEVSLEEYDTQRASIGADAVSHIDMRDMEVPTPSAAAAAAFHQAVIQSYLADLLSVNDSRAVEQVLEFTLANASDIGWTENGVSSIRPVFSQLSSRPLFSLNCRGELTLLLGQPNLTSDERRFVQEWKAELEELFEARWPGYSQILRPVDWTGRVEALIDTLAWRVEAV